ncbi:metallophosphoesterase [Succinimonas amylolytica]|uniref:metallophosphoesterase n=1 Tax=Succinimonas amylolytica TaxID=83769 RepID=UPI00037F09BF|nr:metallophosphoesterase [Succinimonas amylolytica]
MKFLHMGLVILFIAYPSCLMVLSWFLLVRPLNLPGKWRYPLLAVYFAGCFKDLLTNITGGANVVAPEVSYHIVTWMSTLNITVIISLFLAFFIHLGRLFWKISRGGAKTVSFRFMYPVITAAALVLAVIGHVNAARIPEIHKYTFFDERFPRTSRGFIRVVQITDTHFGTSVGPEKARETVELVNRQEPDLILLTGDIIDGKPEQSREEVAFLKDLRAVHGVFGVHGNHEYYSYPEEWDPIWKSLGITMLENENVPLIIDGKTVLYVAGINDRQALRVREPGYEGPDPEKALRGIPPGIPVVLMSHRPGEFDKAAALGADLTLSGHTHGGHIIGLDRIIALLNGGYVSGYYSRGRSRLIVSSGTFLWGGFFCRLGIPAGEIVVVDLVPQER